MIIIIIVVVECYRLITMKPLKTCWSAESFQDFVGYFVFKHVSLNFKISSTLFYIMKLYNNQFDAFTQGTMSRFSIHGEACQAVADILCWIICLEQDSRLSRLMLPWQKKVWCDPYCYYYMERYSWNKSEHSYWFFCHKDCFHGNGHKPCIFAFSKAWKFKMCN